MNPFTLSGLLIAVSSLFFGLFVFIKNIKNRINQVWGIFSITVALWGVAALGLGLIPIEEKESALFLMRITYIGVILIPVVFYNFVHVWLELKRRIFLYIFYLWGIFFSILEWTPWADLFFGPDTITYVFSTAYIVRPATPLYTFFVLSWFSIAIYSHYELYKAFNKSAGLKRNQIKYFFLATAIGFTGGSLTFLIPFGINLYPYFNFTVSLYPAIMAYAILRYHLLDIRVAITRAGIFAVVYTLVLGIPFGIGAILNEPLSEFTSNWWIIPVFIGVVLASTGPFIYMKIQRKVESRLRAEEFKSHEELRRLSHNMLRFTKLDGLLRLIVHYLVKILRLKFAAIYLLDAKTDKYILKSFWQLDRSPDVAFEPSIEFNNDSPLIRDLYLRRIPIVKEELKLFTPKVPSFHVRGLLGNISRLKANTIIPSFLRNELLGFLVLSDRRTNLAFTQEDLNLLMVLSNEAALSIENAQFHQKEKSILAEKSRREALADMAPGASHQFNNRLAAIGSTAEMALLKLEDIIDSLKDENLKKAIKDTIDSLERIDKEVYKGKEITSAILKRAKSKVELQEVDMPRLIENSYKLVLISRSKTGLEGIKEPKFKVTLLNEIPHVMARDALFQDTYYNLSDNAYDAIQRRYSLIREGKPPFEKDLDYEGEIEVILKRENNTLIIEFKDNGIGLKKEEIRRLFTPYFTTKATAGKGTGLGLYVIRDFIEMHKGTIICDSEYGKGTTFTIRLPIRTNQGNSKGLF